MGQQDPGDGAGVLGLEAGQRRERAADPAVAGGGVLLEDQAARPGAGVRAGVPVREEPAVREPVEAGPPGVGVVDGPADVVVAAEVGDPRRRRRRLREVLEGEAGQADLAGGEHRPDLDHQAVVVGEVGDLAGVRAGAEVRREVGRPDDRLGLEQHRRRGDAGHRAQGLGEVVDLGLVLAGGAHPLPEEGDRVEPEHLDAEVRVPEQDLGELGRAPPGSPS